MTLKTTYSTLAAATGACLLAILMVVPSFLAFTRIKEAASARRGTFEVIIDADQLLSALSDAETGERGFVLTGDEAFLEPYLAVQDKVRNQLAAIQQRNLGSDSQEHLKALTPLVDAKLLDMARVIDLRRRQQIGAAVAAVAEGRGRRLMDAIRVEVRAFSQAELIVLATNGAAFQAQTGRLFNFILAACLFSLLVALGIVYVVHRQSQLRVRDLVHLETERMLRVQKATNGQLRAVNANLQESEAKLAITLDSIGDAVIATDADARIKLMNPVAEALTGWTVAEALGHPVDEVFVIINQATRQPAKTPVVDTLAHGSTQAMTNHTLLIARDGRETAIADSCAPIRDPESRVAGAVLVFRNVTQENAAQQALRDNATMIRTILSTVVDGIITLRAEGGLIETVNPAAERMFGLAAAELVGQPFSRLIPGLDPGLLVGSPASSNTASGRDAAGNGHEMEGRRKDGRRFPLEIAIGEMSLGGVQYYTGILRDISVRKQAEEAMARDGALQSAIFNSANFSSIATDAKGVIQIFNVGAEEMLGYTALEVVDKITPAELSDPKEVIARAEALSIELSTPIAPGFEALVFKASRGIEDIYELTLIRKDGGRFPAVVSVTALRDVRGGIIGYLLIGTDNTARRRNESERERLDQALKDKNAELEGAILVAEKANQAKSEFLASMSHELRSPLNAILGFAQLMDSATPPPLAPQKASIGRILHAGWYLLELINKILDLAVIESGRLSLSEEPVSLSDVLSDCRSMIEPQAQLRGIHLAFPSFDGASFVQADRVRLKQVLINLLTNAVKYNRPHGTVDIQCTPVAGNRVRISIQDSGQGIAPDQLRQLFQPFNRLGQENGAEEGTGICLVMSKLLVELMGGEIGVESTLGVGSKFWFDLNTTHAPAFKLPAIDTKAETELPDPTASHLRGVLCVEDNPANLDLIQQLIGRRPDLHMYSAGEATLGIQLAQRKQPAVILMDINLPGMNGIQALKILREDALTAHIPVVAVSANAMVGDIKKGLELGFFRYITKPINVQEFMEALDQALEESESTSAK